PTVATLWKIATGLNVPFFGVHRPGRSAAPSALIRSPTVATLWKIATGLNVPFFGVHRPGRSAAPSALI
ncbi:hypothetical protein CK247_31595, partial [Klebsiella pneumoniae]